MSAVFRIATVDYHTGGEPFRIIEDPGFKIPGSTVAERRVNAAGNPEIDGLRQLLCFEPRGHADMYGGMIVPPDDAGADFGVLFWHKDGFSTACGHGTIALGVWAVESGRVIAPCDGEIDVRIDVPSGRVIARVTMESGRVASVRFINVPGYLVSGQVQVETSRGRVPVDVSFGGAMYAQLPAASVGLEVTPDNVGDLIAIGREIKWALNDTPHARHPSDDRLNGIYGTILYDDLGTDEQGRLHQRNVTIFADGQVDRSPCGSGTAARMATMVAAGDLHPEQELVHHSIVGSVFTGKVSGMTTAEGRDAVIPEITGMAHKTGEHRFFVDPRDALVPGFVLR